MATREVKRQAPDLAWRQAGAAPAGDLWQGWEVNRTPSDGVEITLRTSRPSHTIVWIALTVMLMGFVIVAAAVPAAGPRDNFYSQGFVIVVFCMLVLIAVGGAMLILVLVLPEEWQRHFQLETIEIRPDGLTINQTRFFGREEVFTFNVEPEKGSTSRYGYSCKGIIGTREMVLLDGMDRPTASVLNASLEKAKRLKWAETEYGD